MFKKTIPLLLVLCLIAIPAMAVQLQIDSVNAGHFSKINILRAGDSSISGGVATIDLSTLEQDDTSGAVEVLELSQLDVDQPFLKFSCTEGAANCNSSYTSTNASKVGAVKIDVNGTVRWLRFYNDPS